MTTSRAACAARSERLDVGGGVAAREQEAEVAVALGQRDDGPAGRDRDLEPGDARAPRAPRPGRRPRAACRPRGIGQHHHARRAPARASRSSSGRPSAWRRITSSRLMPGAEAQRARAQAADRARRDLDHPARGRRRRAARRGPGPRRARARRRHRAASAVDVRRERRRGEPRRRHVDRLLEVRARRADRACRTPRAPRARRRAAGPRPRPRRPARTPRRAAGRRPRSSTHAAAAAARAVGVVGADHALAPGEADRLHHAREADVGAASVRRVVDHHEARLGHLGRGERAGASRPCRGSRRPRRAGCAGSRAARRRRRPPARPGRRPRRPRRSAPAVVEGHDRVDGGLGIVERDHDAPGRPSARPAPGGSSEPTTTSTPSAGRRRRSRRPGRSRWAAGGGRGARAYHGRT